MTNTVPNKVSRPSIMVVDDTLENLEVLKDMLHNQGFSVRPFPMARLAIQSARRSPPDLILLDINMPEINGYEACAQLKADEVLRDIPVIFISALNETADKVRAFTAGGVDYITKPFFFEEVEARLRTHLQMHAMRQEMKRRNLDLQAQVNEQIRETIDSQMAMLFALSKLAESREQSTGSHLERIQELGHRFARFLAKKDRYRHELTDLNIQNLHFSSPLHDIGKVSVPDSILIKPGALTPEEWIIMKRHTVVGSATLESVYHRFPNNPFLRIAINIARSHHERWDGHGYPDGLAGEAIPLVARIIAVVDAYDALRSPRPYKKAWSHEEVCKIMEKESGRQFDPDLLEVFLGENQLFCKVWDSITAKAEADKASGLIPSW